jgi:hypothetical protein
MSTSSRDGNFANLTTCDHAFGERFPHHQPQLLPWQVPWLQEEMQKQLPKLGRSCPKQPVGNTSQYLFLQSENLQKLKLLGELRTHLSKPTVTYYQLQGDGLQL